jgi:hypothetical protein
MASLQPLINGHRYSYASIEVELNGTTMLALTSINYGSALTPGMLYGSDPAKVGRTPGKAQHRCDFELYRREFSHLIVSLGPAFGRVPFDIQVQYAENGDEGVTTDKVLGCRITDVDLGNKDGTEPSKVKVTCDPFNIQLGSLNLSIDLTKLGAGG